VLQERLLASRVLHFGPDQLLWECCEVDACETYPERLPPILDMSTSTHFKRLDPLIDGPRLRQYGLQEMDSRFMAHELWKPVVDKYSKSLLTNGGDKLIALSGIAKRMARITGDEYVVGMWKFCLESQLLWWVQHRRQVSHEPSIRSKEYRAPSFSWASVDGIISPGDFTDKGILIEITDVKIDHTTKDVTGPVKGGYIHLNGTLKKLELECDPDSRTWNVIVNGLEVLQETSRPAILLDVEQEDFNEQNDKGTLYCIPARVPFDRYMFFICLILERAEEENGVFRRLGILMTSKQPLIQILLEPHENEKDLPCKEYDEESRKHSICLI
jgi:hypothetical protein